MKERAGEQGGIQNRWTERKWMRASKEIKGKAERESWSFIGQCLMMIEVDWSLGPCSLLVLVHAESPHPNKHVHSVCRIQNITKLVGLSLMRKQSP